MIVETQKLSKGYHVGQERIPALRGIDFSADADDFVVINGPSGSGQSTFLNLIACVDKPTSGEVRIEGQATSHLTESRLAELRKRKIGLVFQTFNLIPVLSAYENVEYPLFTSFARDQATSFFSFRRREEPRGGTSFMKFRQTRRLRWTATLGF